MESVHVDWVSIHHAQGKNCNETLDAHLGCDTQSWLRIGTVIQEGDSFREHSDVVHAAACLLPHSLVFVLGPQEATAL